ncbi:serine/threonine-protein kinase Nek9-like isoform X2 [Lineus longissimus]|uniref:serine/threonine-protein kinase Nek9-like isoform X2 n=1 Tax=Lineus longissimus TaxID=88925 RepID=UPI00315D4279
MADEEATWDFLSHESASSPLPESPQEASYIPVRVLGKGAFGEAVLYRKTEDNSLVVWKEVDLAKLSEKERRDAQTEIDILSLLNHSNVITYYNHFLDGEMLLIEMEYANGGNLYQKINAQQTKLFDEETVIWYYFQLASAIVHIHQYGILHRDIKTLNIFLTKSQLIKLGDFGISKMLETQNEMAESYVGTPYYMSPELIRGDQYNQKSDIWASGCVLYELLTLTKTFDATNPLKLANEIVGGHFEEIDPRYSNEMRDLVHCVLDKDPTKRPTAEEILKSLIFEKCATAINMKVTELNTGAKRKRMVSEASILETIPVVKAKQSEVHLWGGGKTTPQKLEMFKEGKGALQVAAGHSHFAVVTVEKELYTWAGTQGGTQLVGQLGHGDTALYRVPKKVQSLDGVEQVGCGEEFTVCRTDDGELYSCGSNYYGCLGLGEDEQDDVLEFSPINFFTSRPVSQISCGVAHVAALTKEGDVFTWGCGEFGRLGLGSEDDHFEPQKVSMRGKHVISSVCAGADGTFLLTVSGRVLACGSNEYNKLGFNNAAAGLGKRKVKISYDIPVKKTFSTVKPLSRYNIVTVAAGCTHSAVIDLYGHLITFGSNKYGQLGVGDCKKKSGVNVVGGMLTGLVVEQVACGDGFTVISTSDNQIYSWGNGENGRLGGKHSERGKGPNGQCIMIPRPIFGALHDVSGISSCHWNTIIIAEKILHQKTIRTMSSAFKVTSTALDQLDSAFLPDPDDGANLPRSLLPKKDSPIPSMTESSVPPWLKMELEDAEFIPINPRESPKLSSDSSRPDSGDSRTMTSRDDNKALSISKLMARISELEEENEKVITKIHSSQKVSLNFFA